MTDIIDQAQAFEAAARDAAIGRVRDAVAGPGAADCIGCGEAIEAKRLKAMPSATRCIECQRVAERRR